MLLTLPLIIFLSYAGVAINILVSTAMGAKAGAQVVPEELRSDVFWILWSASLITCTVFCVVFWQRMFSFHM